MDEDILTEEIGTSFASVYLENGEVGLCLYDKVSHSMKLGERPFDPDFIHSFLLHAEAGKIILSQSSATDLLLIVRDLYPEESSLSIIPSKHFKEVASILSKLKIKGGILLGKGGFNSEHRKAIGAIGGIQILLFLTKNISFPFLQDDQVTTFHQYIVPIGGLLYYFEKSGEGELDPHNIEEIRCENWVSVDFRTLVDLQIFCQEAHPSIIKGRGRAKEGVSVFNLLNFTGSPQGQRRLRRMLLCPISNAKRLNSRYEVINFFQSSVTTEIARELRSHFSSVSSLDSILLRFRQVRETYADFLRLHDSLLYSHRIIQIIKSFHYKGKNPLLVEVEAFDISIREQISTTFNLEESRKGKKLHINNDISESLDKLRNQLEGLDNFLVQISESMKSEFSVEETELFTGFNLVFVPYTGYLISIPNTPNHKKAEISSKANWKFIFSTEEDHYYSNNITEALDSEIGDLNALILSEEKKIAREVVESILTETESILELSCLIGDLDAMFSLSLAANEYNLVRPIILQEPILDLVEGRHLLTEQRVSPFVPNDIMLSVKQPLMLISGPNSSGKSVLLKQAGLITLLALSGSYVPAKTARIGLFKRILTKFPCQESVSRQMSFFTKEIVEITSLLRRSIDSPSLILIDEFSRGTRKIDGVAIFGAILNALCDKVLYTQTIKEFGYKIDSCVLPLTIATTHCHELSRFKLLRSPDKIMFVQMQVVEDHVSVGSQGVTFLYKAASGICYNSNPFFTTLLARLYKVIITRAIQVEQSLQHSIIYPLQYCILAVKQKYLKYLQSSE